MLRTKQKIGLFIASLLLVGCLFSPAIAYGENNLSQDSSIMPEQVEQHRLVDFIKNREAFKIAWQSVVGILDIFVFIAFVVFALANIFHIKYEEHQVKKVLPGLIIGVILANLSYSICLFFIDFTQRLTDLFIGNPAQFVQNMVELYSWLWFWTGLVGGATSITAIVVPFDISMILFFMVLFLLPALLLLAVGIILWARAYIILALVVFSPLAFFLYFFKLEIPGLSSISQKWMDWFVKWLITGPIIFALFWVAFMLNNAARKRPTSLQLKQPVIAKIQVFKNKSAEKEREIFKELSIPHPLLLRPEIAQATEANKKIDRQTKDLAINADSVAEENSTQNESPDSSTTTEQTPSNSSESNIINIRTLKPSQVPKKLDYFAFGLGLLVSLLAVAVPFGLASGLLNEMGQITAPLKDTTKKAYKYTGLQRGLRKGAYGLLQTPIVKRSLGKLRYGLMGKDKELEEGLARQIESIDKEEREERYINILTKHSGDVKALDPVLVDAIKRAGGEDLAKSADLARQDPAVLADRLRDLGADKLLRAVYSGDKNLLREIKPQDIGDIRSHIAALISQLSNPVFRPEAESKLQELVENLPISYDQLLRTDLRTFNIPRNIAPRPTDPVADQPSAQEPIGKISKEFEDPQTATINQESIRELSREIGKKIGFEMHKAELFGRQMRNRIKEKAREEGLTVRDAISNMKTELEMARELLDQRQYDDATYIMQQYNLPITHKPAEVLQKAILFLESSEKKQNLEQAQQSYQEQIKRKTIEEETKRIINRVAGKRNVSLQAGDIKKLIDGEIPEAVSGLSQREKQKLIQLAKGLSKQPQPSATTPSTQTVRQPEPTEAPRNWNEYYRQIDEAREQYEQRQRDTEHPDH